MELFFHYGLVFITCGKINIFRVIKKSIFQRYLCWCIFYFVIRLFTLFFNSSLLCQCKEKVKSTFVYKCVKYIFNEKMYIQKKIADDLWINLNVCQIYTLHQIILFTHWKEVTAISHGPIKYNSIIHNKYLIITYSYIK